MNQIIQLLVFRIEDRRFGVPLRCVKRVVRAVDPTPLPQAPTAVLGVIDLQGTIIPVLNIRRRFGFADCEIGLDEQLIIAVTSRRTVALRVDETSGVIERPESDVVTVENIVEQADQIAGVVRLEDGLLLIHDLERFLSADEELALAGALTEPS